MEKPVQQLSEGKDGEKDKELLGLQKEPMAASQPLTLTASILRQQERKVGTFVNEFVVFVGRRSIVFIGRVVFQWEDWQRRPAGSWSWSEKEAK
ncbi:hypothetical protein F3Y22_tig00110318pilonHSYRG00098 [Hibiscus syriacus]|uniref:Uncharacterized protein n=1 Tax=Hibiscus syriacus TaxID=106335 RepID=A0A6A3B7B8_HIBSY|nr:hypothetical protein F3Y22_tig00110318pilonHSYRG00098 [Hibiscus syriacus]